MQSVSRKTWIIAALLAVLLAATVAFVVLGRDRDSGDPAYESRVITFEGLNAQPGADVSLTEISVKELRALEQHQLEASYKRTTGLTEEFKMSGPYMKDVIQHLGGNLADYAGIGVVGRDGYYCLLSKEVLESTPDLMLAVVIDGAAKLDEDNAPARLAVQGQFGPYWVKQVDKIILYREIPQKAITSVWVFRNLAQGIQPYEYEYYGSKDDAIDLEQVFSRLDNVDYKAFFTMKSADGFKKNEVINMVKSRYYIKVEGADAPTNVSPFIKLGMNVQNIAWVSTNADAAIFPEMLLEYMQTAEINGEKGITLEEILYETGVETVKTASFDILGTAGEKITVSGQDMSRGILINRADGQAAVIWDPATGHKNIDNLLRIRLAGSNASSNSNGEKPADGSGNDSEPLAWTYGPAADTLLTIGGDGVSQPLYLSLADLKSIQSAYSEQVFSIVNNYPTRKFAAAKGVELSYLLKQAGLKNSAKSIQIEASDGYKASLTKEQLLGSRYRYPNLLSGSAAGAVPVKPILAWAFAEGQDVSAAREGELRLVIGQQGLNDVNTAVSVQMLAKITVSTANPGSWGQPTATRSGAQIVLQHDSLDRVKLHYTLDGTEPTTLSPVYNPSTSYFQPDLIKPLTVSGNGVLKAKAIGYGKYDSGVLSYAY